MHVFFFQNKNISYKHFIFSFCSLTFYPNNFTNCHFPFYYFYPILIYFFSLYCLKQLRLCLQRGNVAKDYITIGLLRLRCLDGLQCWLTKRMVCV